MMRSLWTAASGMTTQQMNLDTISNNLANVNTTGYKKERAEFKSLLYQTLQEKSYESNGEEKPMGIQVGLGVRGSAISTQYSQGTTAQTGNDYDLAIEGNGFFMVMTANGDIGYTRNGSFQMSVGTNGATLATSEGYPVLDTKGNPIVIKNFNSSKLKIDENGELFYKNDTGKTTSLGIKIGIAQFNNPNGSEKLSDSLVKATDASGAPRMESENAGLKKSKIKQGYLEGSNVSAVDEMVGLIVAQRAYELNSKVITASDEMLKQANNLR
jgi:flagellar basal-body rod protein FlgG